MLSPSVQESELMEASRGSPSRRQKSEGDPESHSEPTRKYLDFDVLQTSRTTEPESSSLLTSSTQIDVLPTTKREREHIPEIGPQNGMRSVNPYLGMDFPPAFTSDESVTTPGPVTRMHTRRTPGSVSAISPPYSAIDEAGVDEVHAQQRTNLDVSTATNTEMPPLTQEGTTSVSRHAIDENQESSFETSTITGTPPTATLQQPASTMRNTDDRSRKRKTQASDESNGKRQKLDAGKGAASPRNRTTPKPGEKRPGDERKKWSRFLGQDLFNRNTDGPQSDPTRSNRPEERRKQERERKKQEQERKKQEKERGAEEKKHKDKEKKRREGEQKQARAKEEIATRMKAAREKIILKMDQEKAALKQKLIQQTNFILYSAESVPILHGSKTGHGTSDKLNYTPARNVEMHGLELVRRVYHPGKGTDYGSNLVDFGRKMLPNNATRTGPVRVIDDVDLYLHQRDLVVKTIPEDRFDIDFQESIYHVNAIYVAYSSRGLISIDDYLRIIDIPDTQPVSFSGRAPNWAKSLIDKAEQWRVIEDHTPSNDADPEQLQLLEGSTIEIYRKEQRPFGPFDTVLGEWALGKQWGSDRVGWFPYSAELLASTSERDNVDEKSAGDLLYEEALFWEKKILEEAAAAGIAATNAVAASSFSEDQATTLYGTNHSGENEAQDTTSHNTNHSVESKDQEIISCGTNHSVESEGQATSSSGINHSVKNEVSGVTA